MAAKRRKIKYYFAGQEVTKKKVFAILMRYAKTNNLVDKLPLRFLKAIKEDSIPFDHIFSILSANQLEGLESFIANYSNSLIELKKEVFIKVLKHHGLWDAYQRNLSHHDRSTYFPSSFKLESRIQRIILHSYVTNNLITASYIWINTPEGHDLWAHVNSKMNAILQTFSHSSTNKTFNYDIEEIDRLIETDLFAY